jgi:predicted transcriptional regulator
MTKLLEQAIETARTLPPAMQDEMARVLMALAGDARSTVQLGAEEAASLDESLAQAERGEFATEEEVSAVWAKHGL